MSIQNLKSINKHKLKFKNLEIKDLTLDTNLINEINESITSADTHDQLPTSKAVFDYIESSNIIIDTPVTFSGPLADQVSNLKHTNRDNICTVIFPTVLNDGNNTNTSLRCVLPVAARPIYDEKRMIIVYDNGNIVTGSIFISSSTGICTFSVFLTSAFQEFTATTTVVGIPTFTMSYFLPTA